MEVAPAKAFLPFPALVPMDWGSTLIAGTADLLRPDHAEWLLASVWRACQMTSVKLKYPNSKA